MRIALVTVQSPFVTGGAEFHAVNLKNALIAGGHEAEIVTIPFMDRPVELIEDCIVMSRLAHVENSWAGPIDLAIGLKFPGYYMPHKNKVIWALHQYRAAYELYDTEYSDLKNDPNGPKVRQMITNADNLYLREAKRVYTISKNVAGRMGKFNNIKAAPMYHPCPDMDSFYPREYGDYILMPSRINVTKRQLLAVEAMRHSKSGMKLYIMGKADNAYERDRLLAMIKEYNLKNRIEYIDYVSQEEKFKLYANARAVLFIPFDEDYGYITLEAMAASKAVITASDSGGPLEFVEDQASGFIVPPTAQDIARAIDEFAKSPALAAKIGKAAKKHIGEMEISWDSVVKELTKN